MRAQDAKQQRQVLVYIRGAIIESLSVIDRQSQHSSVAPLDQANIKALRRDVVIMNQ